MNIYIKTAAFATLSFINTLTLSAQNPVANRVRAAAESLPDGCEIVANILTTDTTVFLYDA